MIKPFFIIASITGFLGVALGAFGAHALKDRLSEQMLQTFETGVRYQMYHAFALFAVAWALTQWKSSYLTYSGWLFIAGIVIFSGSLYILAITGQRGWGAVTPLGGLAWLLGWLSLAWGVYKA